MFTKIMYTICYIIKEVNYQIVYSCIVSYIFNLLISIININIIHDLVLIDG